MIATRESAVHPLCKEDDERESGKNVREHSACGIGAIVDLNSRATRESVRLALTGLKDMETRGGSVDGTGDGAGIMVRTKGMRKFLERGLRRLTSAPSKEELFSGHFFFGREEAPNITRLQERIDGILRRQKLAALGWRQVPTRPEVLGIRAQEAMPLIWQLVFARGQSTDASLKENLYAAQLMIEDDVPNVYPVSLQPGTMVLKAMATSNQLEKFYSDFENPDFMTDAALWHRRYSTVASTRWSRAQPFSLLGHNGEINSIRGMREAARNLKRVLRMSKKVLMRGGSDSGDIDRIFQLSRARGVPLDEIMRRSVQPAADDMARMPPDIRDYHKAGRRCFGPLSAIEGPAGIVAMDRDKVVGILDGMGLRPVRIIETNKGIVLIASEVGAPAIPHEEITRVRQLGPGQMVTIEGNKVHYAGEADAAILKGTGFNYKEIAWKKLHAPLARPANPEKLAPSTIVRLLNMFGFDKSGTKLLSEMLKQGKEPMEGMGNDRPLAVFSKNPPPLNHFVQQTITDVTNPALDHLREGDAFDLKVRLGACPRALEHGFEYEPFDQDELPHSIISASQFQSISGHEFDTTLEGDNVEDLRSKLDSLVKEALHIAKERTDSTLIFTDRQTGKKTSALYIPPLLVISAVHQALIENGFRQNVSLVADSGEILETHDAAVLIGNGADAVSPWLLWEYARSGLDRKVDPQNAEANAMTAMVSGLKKVMAKMGIISLDGFRGERLFEAVGLSPDMVDPYLTGMPSRVGGIGLEEILNDIKARASAGGSQIKQNQDVGSYRKSIRQKLNALGNADSTVADFEAVMQEIIGSDPIHLRDLLDFVPCATPIHLEEVMSVSEIFANHIRGAAMSHGALSLMAHRAIAAAFNELGSMSNSGEGGEDARRNKGGNWEAERSKIRQVASGRFGVDALYLMNADEIEIKFSQGAKQREGGHLPGWKATLAIAAQRRTRVGQDLISPPPHHDMYSIEDLALLIQNIRAVNPNVKISVKVASSTDCGVVCNGVAKAGADAAVCISGNGAGTGAAASSSKEHTALPIEIGLADAHHFMVEQGMRDLVPLRADGTIQTSDDFMKLVLMGADQAALGTILLVAGENCLFCGGCSKKGGCTKDICTTENGDEQEMQENKERIKHFLTLFAEGTRRRLAYLGCRTIEEAVGRVDLLQQRSTGNERWDKLDLSYLLRKPNPYTPSQITNAAKTGVAHTLARPAVNSGNEKLCAAVAGEELKYTAELSVDDRSFGATLAGKIATGEIKLDGKTVEIETTENAGQSIGFCMVDGMEIRHTGLANDMVGGSMSGGKLILRLPKHLKNAAGENSIIGNSCAYGATGGLLYAEGNAGQRLGVRNSGATIVAEGAGKYAFEYMTGGTGILLGNCEGSIGAGMTGGELFMFDEMNDLKGKIDSTSVEVKEMDEAALARLHTVLKDYAKETNSKKAGLILNDWDITKKVFKMIVPKTRV
ncbi:hypothetical protein HZA42_04300 [Candidatus Peregrinibacteria bacterium]|nr:hypothetical protein [Candidatus Peregrinibacteria bacterium]